jgi:two-component system chemotaxis response regulator CheB
VATDSEIGRDVVVIGASAGGVEALRKIVRHLPPDLPAAVFVVLHVSRTAPSNLPAILERHGALPAAHAVDGDPIVPCRVYVAPPDHHMVLEPGVVRVVQGPIENRHRPAVDPLFRSAARAYGQRVVGVVLTGALDDGTAGLVAVKRFGGTAVVQDPDDALFPSMPRSALEYVDVDHRVPLAQIPALVAELVVTPAEPIAAGRGRGMPVPMSSDESLEKGPPSAFTCPDCHGTLWEVHEGELLRYQCRVGHAYSAASMIAAHDDAVEQALWAALRSLEESADLARRMAERARERNSPRVAARFEARRADTDRHVVALRGLLLARLTPGVGAAMVDEIVESEAP